MMPVLLEGPEVRCLLPIASRVMCVMPSTILVSYCVLVFALVVVPLLVS
jgi:hypothetical protein